MPMGYTLYLKPDLPMDFREIHLLILATSPESHPALLPIGE
jgi:hypothetical protein